jgi:hypothetical protein
MVFYSISSIFGKFIMNSLRENRDLLFSITKD